MRQFVQNTLDPLRIEVDCSNLTTSLHLRISLFHFLHVQNLFLTAQSTQMKSVISVPIKDCIHHYPRALFNDIPGSGRTFTTYPGRDALLRHTRVTIFMLVNATFFCCIYPVHPIFFIVIILASVQSVLCKN